ncbi:MAG: hypothetical protein O3B73_14810 [bacterium]|nr:hypothetical protein [bacterium]
MPQVIQLKNLSAFKRHRLEGYELTDPELIEVSALAAMSGHHQSNT